MRFNIQTLTLFYIASATAAPVSDASRDTTVYTAAITSISNALTAFDSSINALTPTTISNSAGTLSDEAAAITSALTTSTTNVNAADPLSVSDTISLVTPARNFGNLANSTLNDLITQHDILANAGDAPTVVTWLQTMKSASNLFIAAVVAKVPSALQTDVNNALGSQVTDAFNRGIVAFGGTVSK